MIIHDVEQNTPKWFAIKAGRPSTSCFGSLITGKGEPSDGLDEYAYSLAGEKFSGRPDEDGFAGNRYTRRGLELEPESKSWYEMQYQVEIQEVGFITDDLMSYGASTDGLVGDDGLTEFKNLIKKEFSKLLVYLARNKGKPPTRYIPQVQGELMVTERKWADLVFYHPDFDPIVIRIYPDPEYQAKLKQQIMKVIARRDEFIKLMEKAYGN